jgi:hypothetical protein
MMMHCLGLGGLELHYDKENENVLKNNLPNSSNDYYYEHPSSISNWIGCVDGKCIKALGGKILNMDIAQAISLLPELKVVYMIRTPIYQQASQHRVWGGKGVDSNPEQIIEKIVKLQSAPQIDDCFVFSYEAVLKDPLKHFKILERNGWPIDPVKAASGVNRT